MRVEIEREVDGRWIAEVVDLPGAVVYGRTPADAVSHVVSLALCALAERRAAGEEMPA